MKLNKKENGLIINNDEDPDQVEQDYKISNMIYMMDPEE